MSESISRFVSLAVPEGLEAAGRYLGTEDGASAKTGLPRKPRKPRLAPVSTPSLTKKDLAVNTGSAAPADVQAGLDGQLVTYLDTFTDPTRRAGALIKIGAYRQELAKYQPILEKADPAVAQEAIGEWIAAGDGELKKMIYNAAVGSEELPLAKADNQESGEQKLAKRVAGLDDDRARMQLVQHIATYTTDLTNLLTKAAQTGLPDAEIEPVIKAWVDAGSGSHKDLKAEIVAMDRETRLLTKKAGAIYGTGGAMKEADVVDDTAGNASSHVGAKIGAKGVSEPHKSVPARSTSEGAGPRLRTMPASAPGSASGETPQPGSGPNNGGGGEVHVEQHVTRRGTTGGLGTVDPDDHAMTVENDDVIDPKTGKRRKKFEKGADLSVALVKIMPEAMITELAKCSPADQVEIMQIAAQHGADLMAWSTQQPIDQMQKAALSAAVADWLAADPDSIALKKWTAEALGSAEEIPLTLARAIMAWTPPAAPRLRAAYA